MKRTRKYLTRLQNIKTELNDLSESNTKHNMTIKKRHAKKKLHIIRIGDIVICHRVRHQTACIRKRIVYNGGARTVQKYKSQEFQKNMAKLYDALIEYVQKNKAVIEQMIKSKNPEYTADQTSSTYKEFILFLKNNQQRLLDELLKKYKDLLDLQYEKLFNAIDKIGETKSVLSITADGDPTKLSDVGNELIASFLSQLMSADVITTLKNTISDYAKKGAIPKEKADQILRSFDKPIGNVGKVAYMTDRAVSGIMSGAVKLGEWLSPVTTPKSTVPVSKHNETILKLLWYPRKHIQYAKGNAIPSETKKFGDFMILIENNYADIGQYFSKMTNSVDDALTNILNGCQDMTCSKGNVTPYPFRIKTIKIDETV